MKNFALLENRKTNLGEKTSFYFHDQCAEIICYNPADLGASFANIEKLRKQQKFLVGFVAYEIGKYLQPKLSKLADKKTLIAVPLLHFVGFNHCDYLIQDEVEHLLAQQIDPIAKENFIYNLSFSFSQQEYFDKFARVEKYLLAGDTYQVNLTGKYHFNFHGKPLNFYKVLREQQRVEYSAFLNFGNYQILSLSPELFFKKTANKITTKPMKGTILRAEYSAEDEKYKKFLQQDQKSRAENLMIVDLLRNDLGKIAKVGSVQVEKLFAVESFETVHQLISEITATVSTEISFSELLTALFPCGSVTGAPKLRTIEIIHELENNQRGIYTGALGYIMPDNTMCFNVPIRTLMLQNNKGEMGVGSGIVYDSNKKLEFEEIELKAKFLTQINPGFELIECFLYSPKNGYRYLRQHLSRLTASAKVFNFNCPIKNIKIALAENKIKLKQKKCYKIKLLLHKNGEFNIINEPLVDPASQSLAIVTIANEIIDSKNILFQHKTTATSVRGFYDNVFKKYCLQNNYFDVLLQNEQGFITEGTRSNVFIAINNEIFTPPVASGVLPGIMRQKFINTQKKVIERNFSAKDLLKAEKIWLTNSVRGFVKTKLCLQDQLLEL